MSPRFDLLILVIFLPKDMSPVDPLLFVKTSKSRALLKKKCFRKTDKKEWNDHPGKHNAQGVVRGTASRTAADSVLCTSYLASTSR